MNTNRQVWGSIIFLGFFMAIGGKASPLWALEERGLDFRGTGIVVGAQGQGLSNGREPLEFKKRIRVGERITNPTGSTSEILVGNKALFRLQEETELEFTHIDENTIRLKLHRGTLGTAASQKGLGENGEVTIETPKMMASTQGTRFFIRVNQDAMTEDFQVEDGQVSIRPLPVQSRQAGVLGSLNSPKVIRTTWARQDLTVAVPTTEMELLLQAGTSLSIQGDSIGDPHPLHTEVTNDLSLLPAIEKHGSTPASGQEVLLTQELNQAALLQQTVIDQAPSEKESSDSSNEERIILSVTNNTFTPSSPSLFSQNRNGLFSDSVNSNPLSGSGTVPGSSGSGDNGEQPPQIEVDVPGGNGLLVFTKSNLISAPQKPLTDLLLIDGGNLSDPHLGHFNQNVFEDFRGRVSDKTLIVAGQDGYNLKIPRATPTSSNGAYIDGSLNAFLEWCLEPQCDNKSTVDAILRGRSPTGGNLEERIVTLSGGVVLTDETNLTVGSTEAVSEYFMEVGLPPTLNGSVLSLVAKRDNNGSGVLYPALSKIEDRALAVLNGSTITPAQEGTGQEDRVALLSIFDSHLLGPAQIPQDTNNQPIRERIPPLIEIRDSQPPAQNSTSPGVKVANALVMQATGTLDGLGLDRALLEASSPLVAIVNSTMETTGHFADLSGIAPNQNGLLSVHVPGDAFLRLEDSNLMVNGHLINVTNGAKAEIAGNIFSLLGSTELNGSNLTVNGVLVSVQNGSTFHLNNNAFGAFGTGINSLTISNNLCAGGGCDTSRGFAIAGAGGNLPGTVAIPSGFTPFSTPDGTGINPNGSPRVNIAPEAALLQVDSTSKFEVILPSP